MMRGVINLEGAVALLLLLGILRRHLLSDAGPTFEEMAGRGKWLLCLLLIPAALLWTVSIPLVSDDFVHINAALHFVPNELGQKFIIQETNHFFRPLGYFSLDLDGLWAGSNPARWHLSALLLHFANCLLLYLVARKTSLDSYCATVAAVIFGIHGSRPEAVTWIAGRFDLLASLFVLATLALFQRGGYTIALATALLALISKESAYVLPALLLLIADRARWRRVAPFAVLTGVVFLYRWYVLSGIGGYQTSEQTPSILNFNLLRTLNGLLLRLWAVLFFPVNWSQPPQWWLWVALALGLGGYVVLLIARSGKQRQVLAFGLFILIAALPVQHLLLIGADLEKSRVLYLPSAGFALFLAAALGAVRQPKWRLAAALAIVAFQTACLQHNLILWRGVAQEAERTCDSMASSLRNNSQTAVVLDLPIVLRGVYFLGNGMPECLELVHGIDSRRVLPSHADLIYRWDKKRETVKEVR